MSESGTPEPEVKQLTRNWSAGALVEWRPKPEGPTSWGVVIRVTPAIGDRPAAVTILGPGGSWNDVPFEQIVSPSE